MSWILFVFICFAFPCPTEGNSYNCSNVTDVLSSSSSGNAIFGTLIILNILILVGNPMTILVILFKEKKPYDILILGLAVFDTLTGLIPLPITSYNYFYYLYVNRTVVEQSHFISGGEVGCALYGWSALTFKSGSMLILTIIPFERLLAINFPFWYKRHVKLWKMSLVLLFAVIFSAFHSLLPAIPGISMMKPYGVQKSYCHFEFDEPANIGSVIYTYFIQIYGYGMILVASLCYLLLICSIIQFLVTRRQYTTNNTKSKEWRMTKRTEFMLSIKFLLILILFNIGWLPFLASLTLRTILPHCSSYENIQAVLEFLGVRIAVLNSVINPIVYVLLMQSYRQGYKVLFGTCCHWITCRKIKLFKPDKNNKEQYLSKTLYQKSKEVSHTYSFYSEYNKRHRSLNNSRENVSLYRQESLLASPRFGENGYNSGKNSLTSLPPTDSLGMFQYIPRKRSDVTSHTIREMDEQNLGDYIAPVMPESLSAFTIASDSTINNSTLPRDFNREETVSPSSGNHWSYLFYVNELAMDRNTPEVTSDRDSVYSGIPGYSFVGNENNTELTAVTPRIETDGMMISNNNSNNDTLWEIDNIDRELAADIFANQSLEQQNLPCRLSSTIPRSYKPQSLQSGNLEIYPKRKLARTKAHDLSIEIRTPPHLRILQMEGKVYRKPLLRGQSNPLEPLSEVRTFRNHNLNSNISNSTSVPLKLSELHSLKLSQSSSQLNKASLSPQNSFSIFSPTNMSIASGDTGYASSKIAASGITQQASNVRNSHLRRSYKSVVGFASNMKKRVSKSKSTDFANYHTGEV